MEAKRKEEEKMRKKQEDQERKQQVCVPFSTGLRFEVTFYNVMFSWCVGQASMLKELEKENAVDQQRYVLKELKSRSLLQIRSKLAFDAVY